MKLNLNNPVVFFDLETTGINITNDRIIELCYIKVYPNGNEESKSMRINPEMHIPESSSAIHGIYDEDVADCPTFKQVAKDLANTIKGCDFAVQFQPFRRTDVGRRISSGGHRHRHPQA